MLEELHVRDLALIEDVWLELGPGMTALTGETGAGKTALVEALTLLLGERADSTMVRAGAAETVVEGRFRVEGRETVAKRRVSAEGRSKCVLDGEMVTVGALEEALGPLVDLHGQHEHQALLSPARHAGYLDRFVGVPAEGALAVYREAFDALAEARAARDALAAAQADRDSRLDYLRFQITDIDVVAPVAGEDAELERRLPSLRHAEKLTEAVSAAHADLRGDEGASDRLGEAVAALAKVRGLDPALDSLAAELDEVAVGMDDTGSRLRAYADGIEHDPRALDEAESRLSALAGLKKKYGPGLERVIAARARAAADLDVLESGEQGLAEAEAAVADAGSILDAAAAELSRVRREAAPGFERLLADAARDLAMPGAVFGVAF
ncbi:MAG: DNA repair protein RecN, partial [Coriobacteriaceae bacterium]|nr:DNA repair protein RecN [Coriobacteriaceae bacterium]